MHAVVNVDLLMDGWDHFALWVGVFAAFVGAAAASAAWRTVVVSERQQAADRAERRMLTPTENRAKNPSGRSGPIFGWR